MAFLTLDQIVAKRRKGDTLTPYESSVYRLNYRDDGTRYSSDPKVRESQYAEDNRSEQERFAMAAKRVRESRGGSPTASIVDGRIVFTYPDGSKTSGGRNVR